MRSNGPGPSSPYLHTHTSPHADVPHFSTQTADDETHHTKDPFSVTSISCRCCVDRHQKNNEKYKTTMQYYKSESFFFFFFYLFVQFLGHWPGNKHRTAAVFTDTLLRATGHPTHLCSTQTTELTGTLHSHGKLQEKQSQFVCTTFWVALNKAASPSGFMLPCIYFQKDVSFTIPRWGIWNHSAAVNHPD